MKIEEKNNNLIVFLNEQNKQKFNLNSKIELEKNFKNLFEKINTIYNLNISGSYDIQIYNNEYGIIFEIKQEEKDYFDYYNTIDMHIEISKYKDILYKIENYNKQIEQQCELYLYKGEIYAYPKNNNFQLIGLIIENGEIIYGKECEKIKKLAKKIAIKNTIIEKNK